MAEFAYQLDDFVGPAAPESGGWSLGGFFDGIKAKDLLDTYNSTQVSKQLNKQQSILDARLSMTKDGVARDGLALNIGGGSIMSWLLIGGLVIAGVLVIKAIK